MDPLAQLIGALRRLPTVGPKTARRFALHLLQQDRTGAEELVLAMQHALATLQPCAHCRQLSATPICAICADESRAQRCICVVETLDDLYTVEQSAGHHGRYFVLNGHLSPLDGVGPEELGIPELLQQVVAHEIEEVVLATGIHVEGAVTAQYLADQLKPLACQVTRPNPKLWTLGTQAHPDPSVVAAAIEGRLPFYD